MMHIHFLLVPDSGAARRIRRVLAEGGARVGIVVGTWLELAEHAANAYLLPPRRDDWNARLHESLAAIPDAFWSQTYQVAPEETAAEVESALSEIVSASDPRSDLDELRTRELPDRARQHVDDLLRLAKTLNGALPDELSGIRDLLATNADDVIRRILVSRVEHTPALTRWQTAVIEKLNHDASVPEDPKLAGILDNNLGMPPVGAASAANTSLATLQTNLFASPEKQRPLDHSIQWLGARDYLQEIEIAAGMIQALLDEDPALHPADIGLQVPDDFIYAVAVDDVFTRAGLPVSGLPIEHWQRDLGREAVFHFLYCRDKPAPAMALAVCLSSPLMPWSREDGAVLAQSVMDGNYRLRPRRHADQNTRAMLDLIREGDETPDTLISSLRSFAELLGGGDEYTSHVQQAKASVDDLCRSLANMSEIDWSALRTRVSPKTITTGEGPDFNLEGVTVWRESHEPWRRVRHLLVCGFATGHYPSASGQSPVFSTDDLNAIREHLGLMVDTPAEQLARRRARFQRQLAWASDSVSFLVPRRDPAGAAQAASESLVFMHKLFDTPGADAPEDLVLELDSPEDREQVRFLARAPSAEPRAPRPIAAADINFGRNLLAINVDEAGNQKPESPSSLETLMVSRLAWLLRRLDAEPLGWAPETLDPMLMGTLAHQVFEGLFPSGGTLPEEQDIQQSVDRLLGDAITRSAPFLRAAQWQVERRHLAAEIARAALAWCNILIGLDAELLANEVWLAGHLNGIPIHGQADALVGLPDDRLLVVDYKRSSSSSRRPRMESGYDSQASLYRTMLQTGGPKDETDAALRDRLRHANQAGVIYYMLNDRTALTDSVLPDSGRIPGWAPVEGDIDSRALALIDKYLREIRQGLLTLNREGDTVFFDKTAGIKPYALESSPLIPLFTVPDEAGGTG